MHGQPRIASLALRNMAAGCANQGWRKSAPIEKQQNLPVGADVILDGRGKRFAQSFGGSGTVQIDESHGGWLGATGTLGQQKLREVSLAAILQ